MDTPGSDPKFGLLFVSGAISSTLPLLKTQVACQVTGLIAQTRVTQFFSNPISTPAELEYLFPLPHRAALTDFELWIGSRRIKADLQETEQAEREYERASQNGQQAALLKQNRPNVFAIRLANVMAGESVQAALSYTEKLTLRDGEVEFVFPMGLTPRYTGSTHPEEGLGVNPPVALPGEAVGPVELQVHVDLGVAAGQPHSPSHAILADVDGAAWQIQLAAQAIPDHDFVLRIPTSGSDLRAAAWCERDAAGEAILLNWLPPAGVQAAPPARPRDFIFVLDRSGSMTGDPIRQARNGLKACLRILEPQDTFRILLFDDQLEWYRAEAVPISQAEIDQVDLYLDRIDGRGGTEIIAALEAALSAPGEGNRTRILLFLTDGAVSAEERAIAALRRQAGPARIFTFGIGPSVNRALLSGLARIGRGSAEFLQLDEDIEGAILRFQDRIAFPMLTNLQVEWLGCKAWDSYPELLPDIYSGDALELSARIQRTDSAAQVILSGERGNERIRVPVFLPPAIPENQAGVTRAWARARVDALLEQVQSGQRPLNQVRQEIIHLAIVHHLLTPFTSFVAVDTPLVNAGGKSQGIQIAQPLPAGLDWSGFFPPIRAVFPSMPAPASQGMRSMLLAEPDTDQASPAASGGHPLDRFARKTHVSLEKRSISETGAPPEEAPGLDWEAVLRGLARSQRLDGSWNGDLELTSAALLAFVRHGHTSRHGSYRKQVQKARQWLVQAFHPASGSFYPPILALFELARADLDSSVDARIKELSRQLPAASSDFEKAVLSVVGQSGAVPPAPTRCQSLDDLRLAAALNLHPEIGLSIPAGDPTHLALVWWAALP